MNQGADRFARTDSFHRARLLKVEQGMLNDLPESELTLFEGIWHQLIREQTMLSTTSQLVIAERSSHAIHLDRPDVIIAVVEEHIDQMTQALK